MITVLTVRQIFRHYFTTNILYIITSHICATEWTVRIWYCTLYQKYGLLLVGLNFGPVTIHVTGVTCASITILLYIIMVRSYRHWCHHLITTVRSLENACHTWAPRCDHDKARYKSTFIYLYLFLDLVMWPDLKAFATFTGAPLHKCFQNA